MPNALAQSKTSACVSAKRLVIGHRLALSTSNNCFEQVCTQLKHSCKPNKVQLGMYRGDCGANLRKTLQDNIIEQGTRDWRFFSHQTVGW